MKPPYVPRHTSASKRALLSAIGVAGLGSAPAWAGDIQWGNSNGGGFGLASNWIGGIVPGASDSARFGRTRSADQPLAYTVSFSSSPSNSGVVVGGDRVTLDLNGNVYLLTSPVEVVRVGTSTLAPGRLTLIDGVVATTTPDADVFIGGAANVAGVLTISSGAQLLGPSVVVGYLGPGTLVVQNGGDLVGGPIYVGSGTQGTATVTGTGSAMVVETLYVASFGSGTLNVASGGRVESTTASVGRAAVAMGTVNVDGAGSRWTSSGLVYVGEFGPGTLNITNGGRAQFGSTMIAGERENGPGTINISGAGELIVSNGCYIGSSGPATMSVLSGGVVQTSRGAIGGEEQASVTIDGAGSRWMCSDEMTVSGSSHNAILNVTGGGEVSSTEGSVGVSGGIGSVSVSGAGSRWTMTGTLSVAGDAQTGDEGLSGSVTIGTGGTVTANEVFTFSGGAVQLSGGTLDAARIVTESGSSGHLTLLSGTLRAGLVKFGISNSGTTLAPGRGSSPGRTTIEGDYGQHPAATMEIEIGGATPGTQFDQVVVHTAASLGGTLDLRLINGFVPSPTQNFVILEAGTISGAFANVASGGRLAITGGGGTFRVSYGSGSPFDPTQVVLSEFGGCPSDFNGDGFVNGDDFDAFVLAFVAGTIDADFNSDGFVTADDYDGYVGAFFAGC